MQLEPLPEKYTKGGNINPAWVVASAKRKAQEDQIKQIAEKFFNDMDAEENRRRIEDEKREKEFNDKMEFLKRHSGTPEELELAKSILGIK